MSSILDQGSLLFSSLAVLATTALLEFAGARAGVPFAFSFYTPLLVLAVFFVPGILLLSMLIAGSGGAVGAVFQRDYPPLLTCTAMAWAAASLPAAAAGLVLPAVPLLILAAAAPLYFLFLMFFAVRTVFGTENRIAFAIVALSWLPLIAAAFLWGPLRFLLSWLASPFFLLFAWYYLGSEIGNLGAGFKQSQNFRKMLEASTVNPHDGEAQYQLGLIYQQRRQYSSAIERFKKAIAIDPGETDAHFQLGRIAREQGRLEDAIQSFQTVIDQDEKHSQSEVLRELGTIYLTARQYEDARTFLERYVERRPYDPEGLYEYGEALAALGRSSEAREHFARTIEAVRTAPRYRQRSLAKWSRLAQKSLQTN